MQRAMLVAADQTAGVLTLTLQRPDKRNALNRALIGDLVSAITQHREDSALKLMVLTGAGNQAFASGGDLSELGTVRTRPEALEMSDAYYTALDAVRQFPVPVIAAVNGDALGGGAELAMACDWRVAAHHARIGFLQGKLNITTAWGGGADLIRTVGASRALQLLGSANILSATDALTVGLFEEVAPEAETFADFIARFCAPYRERTAAVMRAFKALANAARAGASSRELRRVETDHFADAWIHDDHWVAANASRGQAGKA